jgi:periplasmic protein TonB
MSAQFIWGRSPPDDPVRRLVWVVPLACLLVSLFILGLGRWLNGSVSRATRPPADVRIYELPPAKGSLAALHSGKSPQPPASTVTRQPTKASRAKAHQSTASPLTKPRASVHLPPDMRSQLRLPQKDTAAHALHRSSPLDSLGRGLPSRPLNLARLNEQMHEVVAAVANRSELPQIHDPDTLIARYYLASVLRKLKRIGDMNYSYDEVGECQVHLVIGANGELLGYRLLASSGNPVLDRVADRIVHTSAPFAPFPADMKKQTDSINLQVTMEFDGYRNMYAR